MNHFLRHIWFFFVCRPFVFFVLGFNVRRYQNLIRSRPAIIVANHNSHLDTIVLMTILPMKLLRYIRPVAAADYFMKNSLLSWFAKRIIGIISVKRSDNEGGNPLAKASKALNNKNILIFFPEGTRGEPERLQTFKRGIAYLAKRHPTVPIIPVFIHGLGKALPKGEAIFVPFFCDIFVGEQLSWETDGACFMDILYGKMKNLAEEGNFTPWE